MMKKKGIILAIAFVSLAAFSFGQENTKQKQDKYAFIIYHNDIKDITIKIDSLIVQINNRQRISYWNNGTTSYDTVDWYNVDITLTDDCISRITSMEWTGSSYVLIEGCDYKIYAVHIYENTWLFDKPTLYNLFENKFIANGNVIGFRFIEDFIQEEPCFLNNLLSIQKNIHLTE